MKTGFATIGIGIAVVLATALPSRSQQPAAKARGGPLDAAALETRLELDLWRQKAEIELAILEAQVEAKRAEIKRITAEHRMRQLLPTVAILRALEKPVAVHFPHETPLEDVLKFLKRATSAGPDDPGIPIYIDPIGLQETGKTLHSTVTLDLEGIPLKTSLRLILKQLGLAYLVKDGLVTITSAESNDVPLGAGADEP